MEQHELEEQLHAMEQRLRRAKRVIVAVVAVALVGLSSAFIYSNHQLRLAVLAQEEEAKQRMVAEHTREMEARQRMMAEEQRAKAYAELEKLKAQPDKPK